MLTFAQIKPFGDGISMTSRNFWLKCFYDIIPNGKARLALFLQIMAKRGIRWKGTLHMRIHNGFSLTVLVMMLACTKFPELDNQISQSASQQPYPNLVPIESIRIAIPEPRVTTETGDSIQSRADPLQRRVEAGQGPVINPADPNTGTDIRSRADALQRRADALRRAVIDPETRKRLETGISVN